MSVTKTWAGGSYNLPLNREPKSSDWGTQTSNFLIAIADQAIPKTGGLNTLSAELSFGATYGVLAPYFKSATANLAAAGVLRLAKTDTVSWRNNANSADVPLGIDSSDNLTYNATKVPLSGAIVNADIASGAAIAYSKLNLTGAILNADLAGSIAYSKLALTGSILNADLAGSIAYSKLNLTGAILNADLAGSIAYSKLNLTGAILNADLAGSIAYSKLSLSGSIATGDLASGMLVPIGKGGTGQTTANAALNALLPSQTSNSGKVLSTDGTNSSWAAALTTTLASTNIFVGNVSNVATAVAMSGDATLSNTGALTVANGAITDAKVNASAAIAGSKIAIAVPGTSAGVISSSGVPGFTNGASIAAGFMGEQVVFQDSSISVSTSGFHTISTLTSVPKGVWLVVVQGQFSTGTTGAAIQFGIATAANSSTGYDPSYFSNNCVSAAASAQKLSQISLVTFINISAITTYYLTGSSIVDTCVVSCRTTFLRVG